MPTLTLLPDGNSINDALVLASALDGADITLASSIEAVFQTTSGFTGTYFLTGTGLKFDRIDDVLYLTGGTVTSITINEQGGDLYTFDNLALSGRALGNATRADREGTNESALEDLFRRLTYEFDGRDIADVHDTATSLEGVNIALVRGNTYNLGAGDDVVNAAGSGRDAIFGGAGNDSLRGNNGNDSIDGGADNDTLFGGEGDDRLLGGAGFANDTLFGGVGDDTLVGSSGLDQLFGGMGNDDLGLVTVATGLDDIDGGTGRDSVAFANAALSFLEIDLVRGEYSDDGFQSRSRIVNVERLATGDSNDRVTGSVAEEFINTGAGDDSVFGGGGSDSIVGGGGNDFLSGGRGPDFLTGGRGADTLDGGAGIDAMTGGLGADVFLFTALSDTGNVGQNDRITDFVSGADVVSLAGLGLTFVVGAFTGADQIRYNTTTSQLEIDANGDGLAELLIELTGVGAAFNASTDLILA